MKRRIPAYAGFISVIVAGIALGQNPSTSEREIRQAAASYTKALSTGDWQAAAGFWTENGSFRDASGKQFNARQTLQAQRKSESQPSLEASDASSTIRFLTPSVAIESGELSADDARAGYTAIWVNQEGWKLDQVDEWNARSPSESNMLEPLKWMIGDWVNDDGGIVTRVSVDWGENGQFLIRRFRVTRDGKEIVHGTERIGWDAARERIRSWAFDSTGGIGEATWLREGDGWIVRTISSLPSGMNASSVKFWIPDGPDTCVLRSSHASVGKTQLEDSTMEFRRQNR